MAPRPNPDELQRRRAQILDEVMRSEKCRLWAQARRYSATDQDADDALEDACVAFLRFFRPEPVGRPAAWMMTTVKHAALHIRRRNSALRERHVEAAVVDPSEGSWESAVRNPGPSLEEQVEVREWVRTRGGLLAELKPDERTALSLIAFGLSYREIAERQGWSVTKTNRCAAEGRIRLRELLAQRGQKS